MHWKVGGHQNNPSGHCQLSLSAPEHHPGIFSQKSQSHISAAMAESKVRPTEVQQIGLKVN